MLRIRFVRTSVMLMLALFMAGLPSVLVVPAGSADDGWARFVADHAVVHGHEECEVGEDGNTDDCNAQSHTPPSGCGFWCWLGRVGGILGIACRYFPDFYLCGG